MSRTTLTLSYRRAGITVALRVCVGAQALAPATADAPPADISLPAPPDLSTALQPETLGRMLHTLHEAHLEVQTDLARSSAAAIEQSDKPQSTTESTELSAAENWNQKNPLGTTVKVFLNDISFTGETLARAFVMEGCAVVKVREFGVYGAKLYPLSQVQRIGGAA